MIKLVFYLVLFFASVGWAKEQIIVVDGDSLELNGDKIRLVGIDSPEYFQTCETSDKKTYDCGQKALEFMQNMIAKGYAQGHNVKCEKVGMDRYQRVLSECYVGAKNLNREMVYNGWAIAYRDDKFKGAESEAKDNRRGIWQGKFMRPELFRILNKYLEKRRQ